MPSILSESEYKAYEIALALRVLESVKPGQTLQEALVAFQTRIVLQQAGLPYRSPQEKEIALEEDLRAAVRKVEERELETRLLKAQLAREGATSSRDELTTPDPESQQPKKRKKKQARASKDVTPDPPLLSLGSSTSNLKSFFDDVTGTLPDGISTLESSPNVLSTLRDLQKLSMTLSAPVSNDEIPPVEAFRCLELLRRHSLHIFATLHSAIGTLLDSQTSAQAARKGKGKEADDFQCLCSLYLATIDSTTRILDQYAVLNMGISGRQDFEDILSDICVKVAELVRLLISSIAAQSRQLYEDLAHSPSSGKQSSRAGTSAQSSREASISIDDSSTIPQDCRTEISQFLHGLCTLSEYRPASTSIGQVQFVLHRYIQYVSLKETQTILIFFWEVGSPSLLTDKQSKIDFLTKIAGAREGIARMCELLLWTSSPARKHTQGKEMSFDLVSQAEQQALLQILSYIVDNEEAIIRVFGAETHAMLMEVVQEVGMDAGLDAIEGLLDVLQNCCV